MKRAAEQTGYSLIEMLAVLAVMSLAVGVALPNVSKMLDSIEFNTKAERLARGVAALRVRAFLEERRIEFPADLENEDGEVEILAQSDADGWRIIAEPITFLESGTCLGGDLIVVAPTGRSAVYALEAPSCTVQRIIE